MTAGFLDAFSSLVDRADVGDVLEIGCGDALMSGIGVVWLRKQSIASTGK